MGICLAKYLTHNISATVHDIAMERTIYRKLHIRNPTITWSMTSRDPKRSRSWPQNFEASYWLPTGNRILVGVHGHVSDDVTCRKLW